MEENNNIKMNAKETNEFFIKSNNELISLLDSGIENKKKRLIITKSYLKDPNINDKIKERIKSIHNLFKDTIIQDIKDIKILKGLNTKFND